MIVLESFCGPFAIVLGHLGHFLGVFTVILRFWGGFLGGAMEKNEKTVQDKYMQISAKSQ